MLGGKLAATVIDVPATRTGETHRVDAHLGGTIAIDDVPLAVLDQFIGNGNIGGLFSATLHLSGKPAMRRRPTATLDLLRGWVTSAFIGDSQLGRSRRS